MQKKWQVLISILCLIALCACGNQQEKYQEQYDLGVKYLAEGNYEEAVIAFEAAIKIDAKKAAAYIGCGDSYRSLAGQATDDAQREAYYGKAAEDYQRAIDLGEMSADSYLGLLEIYTNQNDFENFLTVLEKATEKLGDDFNLADSQAVFKNWLGRRQIIINNADILFTEDALEPTDWAIGGQPVLFGTYDHVVNACYTYGYGEPEIYPTDWSDYYAYEVVADNLCAYLYDDNTLEGLTLFHRDPADYPYYDSDEQAYYQPGRTYYRPDMIQLDMRDILLSDDEKTILTKLGLSENAILFIQNFWEQSVGYDWIDIEIRNSNRPIIDNEPFFWRIRVSGNNAQDFHHIEFGYRILSVDEDENYSISAQSHGDIEFTFKPSGHLSWMTYRRYAETGDGYLID